jgi:hypothetical protein
MELGDSFYGLRNFVKGRISKYELEGLDPLIDRIQEDRNNKAQSTVIISPKTSDDFCKMIGLSDDDMWFYQNINSPYSSYELYDSYQVEQDFKDGYGIWYEFDDDSKEQLNKIAKYFYKKTLDWSDENSLGQFGSKLLENFPRNIGNIIDDYAIEKNREFQHVAEEHVEREVENYLQKFGFKLYGDYSLKTTVADLVSLYLQYGVPHLSIKKLLKEIFKDSRGEIGGWDEDRYEYQDEQHFDRVSFNRTVENELEKIMGNLEDEQDSDSLKKYLELVDKITSKFRIGTWYELPKDQEILFRIRGFDRDRSMIELTLKRRGNGESWKDFSISEEGFNKLLYQPELFRLEF